MLSDRSGSVVVSSLGWIDQGKLWIFRASTGKEERKSVGEAKALSLHAGRGGFFSIVHHHNEGGRMEVTVHHFDDPPKVVSRAVLTPKGTSFFGEAGAWKEVQKSYVSFYAGPFWTDYVLIRIRATERKVELQRFGWYADGYNKGNQRVVGVVEVPGLEQVIVSVQRDSSPVLYDPVGRRKVAALALCGRGGNPTLHFRRRANELWADDYDTLVKLEPGTWRILASRRLQEAETGTRKFIGRYTFDADETLCAVARPHSGDVLALDPETLKTKAQCKLSGHPFEAMVLPDRSVVARDWKSGDLLRGEMKKIPFLKRDK